MQRCFMVCGHPILKQAMLKENRILNSNQFEQNPARLLTMRTMRGHINLTGNNRICNEPRKFLGE